MKKRKLIKNGPLEKGDIVICVKMVDDFSPIPSGMQGTVKNVSEVFCQKQYYINWKNGSKLALIDGVDQWRKVEEIDDDEESENINEHQILLVRTKSDILNNNIFIKKPRL
jgi:hypothetical protein